MDATEQKSRTQVKKEMLALQKLGEELLQLPDDMLEQLELPPELLDAVVFARTIKKHGARRRQMQYLGVLMRQIDPAAIRQKLEGFQRKRSRATQGQHRVEQWRDALVAGDEQLFDDICGRYSTADRQHLSQLIRNARKEKSTGKPPKAARMLFRYLKELEN